MPNAYAQELTHGDTSEHLASSATQLNSDGRLLRANNQLCEFISQSKSLMSRDIQEAVPSPKGLAPGADLYESKEVGPDLRRRTILAQELERTRMARELHDDIGQSLAVLKIHMNLVDQSAASDPEVMRVGLRELTMKLDVIIDKVSRLARGLHSAALELCGLEAAAKSHCRETSEQFGIPVHCYCDQVPDELDSVVALAFFRVLQEGMHNAMKHSGAKNITVRLTASGSYLHMEICDDGVGFDVQSARLAVGLGLVNMRERIQLVGGESEIHSIPNRGTRIKARAPIVPRPAGYIS